MEASKVFPPFAPFLLGRRKEKRIFYGKRITPLPSYGQLFVNFFGVFLILDYDYMCSETYFTQEKSHFHPTSRIPNAPLLFAAALSQNGRIAV